MDVIKAVVTEVIMNNLIGPRNCEIMQIDDRLISLHEEIKSKKLFFSHYIL